MARFLNLGDGPMRSLARDEGAGAGRGACPQSRCLGGRVESAANPLVLAAPRLPNSVAPFAGPSLVLRRVARADHVHHRQQSGAVTATQDGEVGSLLEYPLKQIGHEVIRRVLFESDAEADEMDKDRLAIAPVGAVTWMLGHVGVHDQAVSGVIPEPPDLVGLHLAKRIPAPRRTRNVRVDRTDNVGERAAASRACHSRAR